MLNPQAEGLVVKWGGLHIRTAGMNSVHTMIILLGKLWGCHLTDTCCGHLAAALRTSQSLTELELHDNDLGDAGVQQLCSALNHPNCKLQRLW